MISHKMASILLVGGGLTGAASAAFIRQNLPEASIHLWDKARGSGGRMSTSRCPDDPTSTMDLGAQYITLTEEYMSKRASLYKELSSQGILDSFKGVIEGPNAFEKPGCQHFVTPNGSGSLVKYFLQQADADVRYQHLVSDISFSSGSKVKVTTSDNKSDDFDVVILTLPVPQILQLKGSIQAAIENQPEIKKKLQDVSYSSRFALGLFYAPNSNLPTPWSAKYIADNPCIRYIANDNAKRGKVDSEHNQALVVHTNVPYGLARIDEDISSIKDEILHQLHSILPDLPQPVSIKPQKWRYSQVHEAFEGKPGCITVSRDPLVILAGDAFTMSTFDGCLDSAETVLKTVTESLPSKSSSAST